MIYILQGSCGQYSDRTDWIVKAYRDKDAADSDRTKADYEAAECKKAIDEYEESPEYYHAGWKDEEGKREDIRASILTVDVNAQFDYTGTTYWVVPCELI